MRGYISTTAFAGDAIARRPLLGLWILKQVIVEPARVATVECGYRKKEILQIMLIDRSLCSDDWEKISDYSRLERAGGICDWYVEELPAL
jgi:hypothetical protein